MNGHNKLYGKALYMLVYQAAQKLPAPVTNKAITDHLVRTYDPGMNGRRRQALHGRVERTTRNLRSDGLLTAEKREGFRRFVYHELKPAQHGL